MVQASDAREGDDLGSTRRPDLDSSTLGRIPDRRVNALAIVVRDVLPEQAFQMILPENNDVVEQLSAHTPDETLRGSVLPGTLKRRPLRVNPKSPDRTGDLGREDRVVVEDQMPMSWRLREGIS